MAHQIAASALLLLICVTALFGVQVSSQSCGSGQFCPAGMCCGPSNQCGTTPDYCSIGCQPSFGQCTGRIDQFFESIIGSKGLQIGDILYSQDGLTVYVIISFKGALSYSIVQGTQLGLSTIDLRSSYWCGAVLQAPYNNLKNLSAVHFALANPANEDFYYVGGSWSGTDIRMIYNIGPIQGVSDPNAQILFANVSGANLAGTALPAGTGRSTGMVRISTLNWNLNNDGSSPSVVAIANLTTSDFDWDGAKFHLAGSFTLDPLISAQLNFNENPGPRSNCVGSRSPFQWCVGAEDGWSFDLDVSLPSINATASFPVLLYSQATGTVNPTNIQTVSVSKDASSNVYACYSSNSPYVVWADPPGSNITFTPDNVALFHTNTTPGDNMEIFCVIRQNTYLSYTNLAMDGTISSVYATAAPDRTHYLYFAAAGSQGSSFNLSAAQDSASTMSFQLTTDGTPVSIFDINGTMIGDMIAVGSFSGSVPGDPSQPFLAPISSTGTGNNLFLFYFQGGGSPTTLSADGFVNIGGADSTFSDGEAIPAPDYSASNHNFLFYGIFQSSSDWKYGGVTVKNTTYYGVNAQAFVWGLYNPNTVIPSPPAPASSTPHGGLLPTSQPTPSGEANTVAVPALVYLVVSLAIFLITL